MSLCTGQVVYASLAQMSVKGAANTKLESLSVGMLDVFSSAFWTHPSYAHSVIRNCDKELTFSAQAAGVQIFEPPRSMDVVYNMFAVVDLPGLVNIATIDGEDYEVVSSATDQRVYSVEIIHKADKPNQDKIIPVETDAGAVDILGAINSVADEHAYAVRLYPVDTFIFDDQEVTELPGGGRPYLDCDVIADGLYINNDDLDNPWMPVTQPEITRTYTLEEETTAIDGTVWAAGDYDISFTLGKYDMVLSGLTQREAYTVDVGEDTYNLTVLGCGFVGSDHAPHYVDSVGQWLIKDVEMTIGGARVGLLNSMYMYIYEELFGMPGRRQEDMIGKTEAYEPETIGDAGSRDLEVKSKMARRLYIQLPFWWTGGKMERALKTIALQLHKIQFKIQTRKLEDCIAFSGSNLSGQNLPSIGSIYKLDGLGGWAVEGTDPETGNLIPNDLIQNATSIKTYVRYNEHIAASNNEHLIGEVRRAAAGNDVFTYQRKSSSQRTSKSTQDIRAYLQVDFCGIFLNQKSRDVYLKLDEKTLFSQVLGTDTDGVALDDKKTGQITETLNFSNAVSEIMVALHSVDASANHGDTFGLRGTSLDKTLKLRDDALKTLSFDISSTPRTITHLSADYYRHITQYQNSKLMSPLKGLYYYNIELFSELNGTRCVNSFINASKIDDLRVRFQVNNGKYGMDDSDQLLKSDGKGAKIYFYGHIYNTLQIRNGMAGAMFA